MNIKPPKLNIDPNNPYGNCQLNRKEYGDILKNIISHSDEGFVLAINNKWGTGKSTFLNMWKADLELNKEPVLYFNAWENDFEDNAQTALLGELKSLETNETEEKFKKILSYATKLGKGIIPSLTKAIVSKYIETEEIVDLLSKVSEEASDIFEGEISQYLNKKESIHKFKDSLSQYIEDSFKDQKLIFIIDELDRCRPNYAVSILEQLKHFFSVNNIVFVLSIDKIQLGNAIKGVYGSEQLDSNDYLRRFIDIEYSIPDPSENQFFEYLYNYFEFDTFFRNADRTRFSDFRYDKDNFITTAKLLFDQKNIALRLQEKILSHSRLAINSFNFNSYVTPHFFLLLSYIKVVDNDFYEQIKSGNLEILELQKKYKSLLSSNLDEDQERIAIFLEFWLVNSYINNIDEPHSKRKIINTNPETRETSILINSIINESRQDLVESAVISIQQKFDEERFPVTRYMKYLDLLK